MKRRTEWGRPKQSWNDPMTRPLPACKVTSGFQTNLISSSGSFWSCSRLFWLWKTRCLLLAQFLKALSSLYLCGTLQWPLFRLETTSFSHCWCHVLSSPEIWVADILTQQDQLSKQTRVHSFRILLLVYCISTHHPRYFCLTRTLLTRYKQWPYFPLKLSSFSYNWYHFLSVSKRGLQWQGQVLPPLY